MQERIDRLRRCRISKWEADFLDSIEQRIEEDRELTEAQSEKLAEMEGRYGLLEE